MYDIGAETKESLDRADLNVEISRRELNQLAEQIGNQKEYLDTELKDLDLQISIQKSIVTEYNIDF